MLKKLFTNVRKLFLTYTVQEVYNGIRRKAIERTNGKGWDHHGGSQQQPHILLRQSKQHGAEFGQAD